MLNKRYMTAVAYTSLSLLVVGCESVNLNEGASTVDFVETTSPNMWQTYYKSTEKDALLKKGDNVSVNLSAVFICDFRESGFFTGEYFDTSNAGSAYCGGEGLDSNRHTTRGEIVVLSNVLESTPTTKSEDKKKRVIFYTNDARESGQLLNFENLPIYGPIKYNGGPFSVSFSILELDENENKNIKSMLKSLASFAKLPAIPFSEQLGVLTTLGAALVESNTDDVELSYEFNFDAAPDDGSSVEYKPLKEGFYLIRREENRSKNTNWAASCFNRKIGKPVYCSSHPQAGEVDRSQTWIVFRVRKESEEFAAPYNNLMIYEENSQSIRKGIGTADAKSIEAVNEFFKSLIKR